VHGLVVVMAMSENGNTPKKNIDLVGKIWENDG
jgi:hypothetical protein